MDEIENEITKIVATTHLYPQARAKLILEVLESYGWHSNSECLKGITPEELGHVIKGWLKLEHWAAAPFVGEQVYDWLKEKLKG